METIYDYLRTFSSELGARIVESYPALQAPEAPPASELGTLLRPPLAAQALAVTGLAKYLRTARSALVVGECGTGKTYMSLATAHVLAKGATYTGLVMCPAHIVHKWARETLKTLPGVRTFVIEDFRDGGDPAKPHGIVEVKLDSGGNIVTRGLKTTLSELRSLGRAGWRKLCPQTAFFIMGKDKAKLGYFWKPAYGVQKSGTSRGSVINPETGFPIPSGDGGFLCSLNFHEVKHSEVIAREKGGTNRFSPLWEADRTKIRRTAPLDYIGRYMQGWWDFAIADEMHQLAGDTAQGNGLGVLYRCSRKLLALTGTLMGGYADDLFNILFRSRPHKMVSSGFEAGSTGRRDFQKQYGVLETIEKIRESDNACTRAPKRSVQIVKKPGASPLLFGNFLMESTAFVSLEDISDSLPPYEETVLLTEMDADLAQAYKKIEEDIRQAITQHRGNKSVMSLLLNTLLLYPDHPYGFDTLYGKSYDPLTKSMIRFPITQPAQLDKATVYAKEKLLIEDLRKELREGRRCLVYATYTGQRDVTARLEQILSAAGLRVAVLRSTVATDKRERWFEKKVQEGVEVVVCHPRLVETGLDLLSFPTLYFYETGYSLHTVRQAKRRSWRIGQQHGVRVKYLAAKDTMQETCLRLMGKKTLVAEMMEGKFSGEGLQSLDVEDDMMTSLARELVQKGGVGESADAIWKSLQQERSKHVVAPRHSHPLPAPQPVVEEVAALPSAIPVPTIELVYSAPEPASRYRRKRPSYASNTQAGEQMRLFA